MTGRKGNAQETRTSLADTLGPLMPTSQGFDPSAASLVAAHSPHRRLADLVLPEAVRRRCQEFHDDHQHAAALHTAGLIPRNRILLDGPPGNERLHSRERLLPPWIFPSMSSGMIASLAGICMRR
jgi:hypothetical protein